MKTKTDKISNRYKIALIANPNFVRAHFGANS